MISIHALREEGDVTARCQVVVLVISIHALREEGDSSDPRQQKAAGLFLSTPSARRATVQAVVDALHKLISIHALREEGDMSSTNSTGWSA